MQLDMIRRVRMGNVKRLLRHRYGVTLPDDDAGRDGLEMLLCLSTDKNMPNVIETWAPWLPHNEADRLIAHVKSFPPDMRTPSPSALGQRLRITHHERESLGVWQLKPVDISKENLAEFKKAKNRARAKARRRKKGGKSREAYLAQSITKQAPWKAEGIDRATWYRRKARAATSPYADQTTGGRDNCVR